MLGLNAQLVATPVGDLSSGRGLVPVEGPAKPMSLNRLPVHLQPSVPVAIRRPGPKPTVAFETNPLRDGSALIYLLIEPCW